MPIILPDDAQRAAVDVVVRSAQQHFAATVGGIYRLNRDPPEQIGSCAFIAARGQALIVTAGHAIKDIPPEELGIGTAQRIAGISAEFSHSEWLDVAVGPINEHLARELPEIRLAPIEGALRERADWMPPVFMAVGLPNQRNKTWAREGKRTVEAFVTAPCKDQRSASFSRAAPDTHLFLRWRGKQAIGPDGVTTNPPKPKGMSGGPIIDLGDIDALDVIGGKRIPIPKIAGILLEWDRQTILALRISAVAGALDHFDAWPTAGVPVVSSGAAR